MTVIRGDRSQLIVAFALLYVIWGSTYFAVRILVVDVPAFFAGGTRFWLAGSLAYLTLRLRGERAPTAREWGHAALTGIALFCAGNGIVMYVEQFLASGLTALVIAMSPVCFALVDWLRPGGARPSPRGVAGIVLGSIGAAILADPGAEANGAVPVVPLLLLMFGCFTWVSGSLYAKHHPRHPSLWMSAAQQMVCGGSGMLLMSFLMGEGTRLAAVHVTLPLVLAFAFLVVCGSWIGFGAYMFLLERVSSAQLSTYAYVNPVVALGLGALWLDEPFTLRTALAAVVILCAVAVVQTAPRRS